MRRGFLFILSIVLLAVPALSQGSGGYACGVPFNNSVTGYGGVEVCGYPYACGVADGVCPERFSQGGIETNKSYRTQPYVQYAYPDSTDAEPFNFDVYANGSAACAPIAGNCSGILTLNETSGNWTDSSYTCSDPSSSYNSSNDYRANCTDVPNVAGCEYCQDPDCRTNLTVMVTDSAGNPVEEANVRFVGYNDSTSWEVEADSGELVTDVGFTGFFNVTCGSDFYYSTQKNQEYIQPGTDVLYCPGLQPAGCTENGTSPNQYGEMVCRTACQNETSFTILNSCNGLPRSAEVLLGRENETHVEYGQCCGGSPTSSRYVRWKTGALGMCGSSKDERFNRN